MKIKKTSLALIAALALIAVLVAACGGDDRSKSSSSGTLTDSAFITDMTAHHQGAIEVAKLAQKQADHTQIRTLADDIIAAQEGEIGAMRAVRDDMHAMGTHDGGHMGMSRQAMGMDMDLRALKSAQPFDKAFIDAMVPHHQGAIAMAKVELAKGAQPGLRRMAKDIISAQTKEIAQMRQWRRAWYGSAKAQMDKRGHGSMGDMHRGS
jgi:uncharacterized protein (DUF305 family)